MGTHSMRLVLVVLIAAALVPAAAGPVKRHHVDHWDHVVSKVADIKHPPSDDKQDSPGFFRQVADMIMDIPATVDAVGVVAQDEVTGTFGDMGAKHPHTMGFVDKANNYLIDHEPRSSYVGSMGVVGAQLAMTSANTLSSS